MVTRPCTPSLLAITSADPADLALTRPVWSTVSTSASLDDQSTVRSESTCWRASRTSARRATEASTMSGASPPWITTAATTAATTNCTLSDTPPAVAIK